MLMILGIGHFGITMEYLPRVLSAYQCKHNRRSLSTFLRK